MLQQIQQVIDDQCPQLLRCPTGAERWRMSLCGHVEVALAIDDDGLLFRGGPLAATDAKPPRRIMADRSGAPIERRIVNGADSGERFVEVRVLIAAGGDIPANLFAMGLATAIATVGTDYLLQALCTAAYCCGQRSISVGIGRSLQPGQRKAGFVRERDPEQKE